MKLRVGLTNLYQISFRSELKAGHGMIYPFLNSFHEEVGRNSIFPEFQHYDIRCKL